MNATQQFIETWGVLIMPLWFLFVIGLILLGYRSYRRSIERLLQRVAKLVGGQVVKGISPNAWDDIHIRRGDTPATLSCSGWHPRQMQTHFSLPWLHTLLRCEIFPAGPWPRLRKLMGMRDVTIGSAQFDDEFVINTDDENGAREFLTPAVQSAIFGLDRFAAAEKFGSRCLHVQVGGGRIVVSLPFMVANDAALVEFVRLGLALIDACHQSSLAGIKFLERSSVTAPHCMVCGEPLVRDVVQCRRCKTPHHRECWSYCGGCSTYGCREKLFLEPPPLTKAG